MFNTVDAMILSWWAILNQDSANTVLNVLWISAGIVGIVRAFGF